MEKKTETIFSGKMISYVLYYLFLNCQFLQITYEFKIQFSNFLFFLLFSKNMKNPWQVKSIEDFYCLKCPECEFNSKEEDTFQDHAVLNHPMSAVLFGKFEQNLQRFEEDHLSLEQDYDMTAKDPLTVDLNLKSSVLFYNEIVLLL